MYRLILPLLLIAAVAILREAPAQIKKIPGADQLRMQRPEGCRKLAPPPEATPGTDDPPGKAFCCEITKNGAKGPAHGSGSSDPEAGNTTRPRSAKGT